MQIFIKTLSGETLVREIAPEETVSSLKQSIFEQYGISEDLQRLVSEGSILNDNEVLSLKLKEESTLYLTAGLDGGKKKKKKKAYTTKKKNKHKHKTTQKMFILDCYKFEKEGNVKPARKQCPECQHFMAKHFNRYYCGFCHLTLKLDEETIKANQRELEKKKGGKGGQDVVAAGDKKDKAKDKKKK